MMVPLRNLEIMIEHLEKKKINHVIRYVWA